MESTPQTAQKFKRKTLLVNRKLQLRIMAYITAVSALSSLITSLSYYLLLTYAEAWSVGSSVSLVFAIAFSIMVGWTVLVLLFSNRIFGPIYRLHREIRNWRDGIAVEKITLRRGDHLTELIDDFNELAAKSAPQPTKR